MSLFRRIIGLFRRKKLNEVRVHYFVAGCDNATDFKQVYGQHSWPVALVREQQTTAYWRHRDRRASNSLRRSSEAFAAAVIAALQEGLPS